MSSSRLNSSTFALDYAKLGFMAFLHGFGQVDVSMLLVDVAMMGVLLMLRWGGSEPSGMGEMGDVRFFYSLPHRVMVRCVFS